VHKVEIGLRHHWGGKLQHQNIFNPEFDDLKRAAIAIMSEPYFGCRNHGDFLQSGSVKQIFFVMQAKTHIPLVRPPLGVRLRVRLKNNKIDNPVISTFRAIYPLFGDREHILNSLDLLRMQSLRSNGFVLIVFRSLRLAECRLTVIL
jgi:hypothetical protein